MESDPVKAEQGELLGVEQDPDSRKRTSRACIRCRFRHTRCPGGQPCGKCQMAKTKCEYVEYEKRLVVSRKYLYKLQEDIVRLKKENAALRAANESNGSAMRPDRDASREKSPDVSADRSSEPQVSGDLDGQFLTPDDPSVPEVIHPSLDKHGRLIQSRTGEKLYVGSSSMTLFGLEIENMAPPYAPDLLHSNSLVSTPAESPQFGKSESRTEFSDSKRETKILEKEGNAYNITLAKTNTRPGLSVNFTLPSYSYAILLVDTFINYNDGCFYFFNEGLVKRFLMNLYSGRGAENKKIIKRNMSSRLGPAADENTIKKDTDDDTILETIWFCKILLIFAIGEMYLGTESDTHMKNSEKEVIMNYGKNKTKKRAMGKGNTLPGSGFFYQASELFTGLFASGAIDNITKDGGIEVMLLYAFYLQVADCTIASYFYFGLALRSTLILGWHVDADMENLNRFELEHRRRIWWTVYMYERMLSSKAGLPLSFADDSVSTELPFDFKTDLDDFPRDENDVRGYYIFPSAEYINNCVTITQINAIILSSLYTKQPTANILPVVSDLVQRLFKWKNSLPQFLRVDFSKDDVKISRLIVNLMTEYFQGMNLAVRPLLFHFATKKLKELQLQNNQNKYIDLTQYSKNVLTLLNASFQASINSIKCIWALLPQNMVALFGWMDREYLFTSASTLILFNASFGVHDATRKHLDHALTLFTKMKKLGNYPAALRRAQLLKLIRVLDFNGVMQDLLQKHDDDDGSAAPAPGPAAPMDVDTSGFGGATSFAQATKPSTYAEPIPMHAVHPMASGPEPLQSNLDFIQFNGPVPSSTRHASNRHTPTIPASANLANEETFRFNGAAAERKTGDGYFPNRDLAGIEGLTYLDEEQKLWNEITNDAGWLQPSGVPSVRPESQYNFGPGARGSNLPSHNSINNFVGAYTDIVNLEFHEDT
ncbi:putative proline utilization trans-activator [Clavispora lusitaniae]|uniref:Proline utilization trans-activator n=1 Tax=Clavispora lusitaniae TaxID=36911 RepID=A0ACD0WT14_CLALS|nr:putative proline utilization trans-activator [Clavispora lusitaniae]QFZ36185.1 putative proline utilization trans-activator [Clavispora lusitaniae]QFZ41869.1 putative proline utilization trans-activator [Clavispora lusitaniae]QFZ47545.1 putative proline utilization trans-activator [Clavispora lusitaniae]QFZ53224.1 putative proline utilization trans-activator [Clavispora lusitaniae]